MAKKQEIQNKRYELYERAHTKEYYAVAKWLSEVSFTPAILGADQTDVWRKIEKLCELYEAAIDAERARNAKLERKLRSMATKHSGTQVTPEQPVAAQGSRVPETNFASVNSVSSSAPVLDVPSEPVQKEITKTVAQVMNKTPKTSQDVTKDQESVIITEKKSSHDDEILFDLIREFGPDKGGKPNG